MEANSNDNYVLVLEDRTEVKNEKEAGKLSVVSGIDDKGNLKTTEAIAANQAAFLKFNNKDGLLKNFMTNFLKQFNNPTHFGLYKVLRQFGIRICLEKFQFPTLFNAHGQCLWLILEETVCSQCRTEIHEEVMYGAMA